MQYPVNFKTNDGSTKEFWLSDQPIDYNKSGTDGVSPNFTLAAWSTYYNLQATTANGTKVVQFNKGTPLPQGGFSDGYLDSSLRQKISDMDYHMTQWVPYHFSRKNDVKVVTKSLSGTTVPYSTDNSQTFNVEQQGWTLVGILGYRGIHSGISDSIIYGVTFSSSANTVNIRLKNLSGSTPALSFQVQCLYMT